MENWRTEYNIFKTYDENRKKIYVFSENHHIKYSHKYVLLTQYFFHLG